MFSIYLLVIALFASLVYILRRHWTANLFLLLFTLAFFLTAVEAYYRFFYCQSDGFGMLMKNFAHRYYHLDSYGFRSSHLPFSKTKDNLVLLGDSHVFGAGLKHSSDRFGALLAKYYPQLHVVTLGMPGWDTKTEIAQFQKYAGNTQARSQLVILAYFFNDIEEEVTPEDKQRDPAPYSAPKETRLDRLLQSASKYSRALEMFYYRIGYPRLVRDRLAQIQVFYNDPLIRERHLATIQRFRDLLKDQYSAHLLLLLLPYLHSEALLHQTQFYESFEKALSQHSLEFVSMQPVFAKYEIGKLRVNRFDPHTNTFANRLIADAIAEYLNKHPSLLSPNHP